MLLAPVNEMTTQYKTKALYHTIFEYHSHTKFTPASYDMSSAANNPLSRSPGALGATRKGAQGDYVSILSDLASDAGGKLSSRSSKTWGRVFLFGGLVVAAALAGGLVAGVQRSPPLQPVVIQLPRPAALESASQPIVEEVSQAAQIVDALPSVEDPVATKPVAAEKVSAPAPARVAEQKRPATPRRQAAPRRADADVDIITAIVQQIEAAR